MKATLAPAPKAPKAGTTVIGLTKAGGVGGTGGTGGVTGGTTGVTGVSGVTTAVVEEPPPHPTKNTIGNTKVAKSLEIFIRYSENKIHKSKKAQPC
jgi:hypothetical protein